MADSSPAATGTSAATPLLALAEPLRFRVESWAPARAAGVSSQGAGRSRDRS